MASVVTSTIAQNGFKNTAAVRLIVELCTADQATHLSAALGIV